MTTSCFNCLGRLYDDRVSVNRRWPLATFQRAYPAVRSCGRPPGRRGGAQSRCAFPSLSERAEFSGRPNYMKRPSRLIVVGGLLSTSVLAACSSAMQQTTASTASGAPPVTTAANNQTARRAPNAADVHFMSGMIPHHAQAVLIAGWAPTHGARSDVRVLC